MKRRFLDGRVKTLPYYAFLSPIYILALIVFGIYLETKLSLSGGSNDLRPAQQIVYSDTTTLITIGLVAWWSYRIARRCRRRSIIFNRYSIYFADFNRRLRYRDFFANPQTLVPVGLEFIILNPGIVPANRSKRKAFLSICYLKPFPILRQIQLEGLNYVIRE